MKNRALKALIDLCVYFELETHGSPDEIAKRIGLHFKACRGHWPDDSGDSIGNRKLENRPDPGKFSVLS